MMTINYKVIAKVASHKYGALTVEQTYRTYEDAVFNAKILAECDDVISVTINAEGTTTIK